MYFNKITNPLTLNCYVKTVNTLSQNFLFSLEPVYSNDINIVAICDTLMHHSIVLSLIVQSCCYSIVYQLY